MKLFRAFLVVSCLLIFGAGSLFYWLHQQMHTSVHNQSQLQPFSVARGESLDSILNGLQARGIIDNALAVRIYLRLKKQVPTIQAGTYSFDSPSTPLRILAKLKEGGQFERLTIIEG